MTEKKLQVFYDGDCPVCRANRDVLQSGADSAQCLEMIDVREACFSTETYGLSQQRVLSTLCAIDETGRVHEGMDAVYEAYRRKGFGWVLAVTRVEPLRTPFDRLYALITRHRFRISGLLGRLISLPEK